MSRPFRWLLKNDPLGATVKGVIGMVFGVAFFVAGSPVLGAVFLAFGAALTALPLWLRRRDRVTQRR